MVPRAPSENEAARALDRLGEVDRALEARGVSRLTLDAGRTHARPLRQIADALLGDAEPPGLADAFADGLSRTAYAIAEHFPGNLLADLDHLAASVLREARAAEAPAAHLRASFDEIEGLHALFGRGSSIRFRYTHDFVYGFDWAKWVRREPEGRSRVGPFDLVFLRAMRIRGGELLALIEQNDATYPRLEGEHARNPFAFSREPDAELTLYRDLAARDLVPVRAWTFDAPSVWDRPFAEERVARAAVLGLER